MRFHNLVQNQEYPSCTTLAREFEVSIRTIKPDLDFMKYRMDLPLEFDGHRNGYHYTRPVEQFPQLPISEAEVFALLVAHKAIAQYRGTPFERPLEMAFRKLTGQLDRSVQFSLGNLDEVLSFRPFAPEDADLETFQIITRGFGHDPRFSCSLGAVMLSMLPTAILPVLPAAICPREPVAWYIEMPVGRRDNFALTQPWRGGPSDSRTGPAGFFPRLKVGPTSLGSCPKGTVAHAQYQKGMAV